MLFSRFKQPHQILILFGFLLLLVGLFSVVDRTRRTALESVRIHPGTALTAPAHP